MACFFAAQTVKSCSTTASFQDRAHNNDQPTSCIDQSALNQLNTYLFHNRTNSSSHSLSQPRANVVCVRRRRRRKWRRGGAVVVPTSRQETEEADGALGPVFISWLHVCMCAGRGLYARTSFACLTSWLHGCMHVVLFLSLCVWEEINSLGSINELIICMFSRFGYFVLHTPALPNCNTTDTSCTQ